MFPNTRSTPHTRIPTTQSRHNIASFSETIIEVPQGSFDIQNTPRHFQYSPPDYPDDYYFNSAVDFEPPPTRSYNRMNTRSSPPTAYGNVIESHWTLDPDGNVVSTMGQIQSLPSDAGTADLDNLESVPLPPDTTPPPPPLMRTAQLPSTSSSGGPSGRTSRLGSLPIIPETDSWEENALLKEPNGTHGARTKTQTVSSDVHIRRLRDLLSQPQSRRSSPPSRILPDQPLFSSPMPDSQSTEMFNRLHTFSPFRSSSSSGTRRGSSRTPQMHHGMPFEPQSTSSPPRSTSQSPPHIKEPLSGRSEARSDHVPHPRGPADAPPPRQSPVASRCTSTVPPSHPYPELYDQPPPQVPVNLPHLRDPASDRQHESMFDSQYRPTTSNAHYRSQEPPPTHQGPPPAPADSAPSHPPPPPPQWPGCETPYPYPSFCPVGYVPYHVAERIENGYAWDGYAWRRVGEPKRPDETGPARREGTQGADLRASEEKTRKDHSGPAAPSRTPMTPSRTEHGVPSGSPLVEDVSESMHRRLDKLHRSVIHEHWTNLDSYFKRQTDPAFIAFVGPHISVSSRIRRLLDKLLRFLAGARADYTKIQAGSEHWHGSWRKQLSSLDRTMQTFCEFSRAVCSREPSFRMLDKVLGKFNQYETKFRDLTKKIYTLLNRLRLRAVHSDLVKAHAKAQEQLRIAGSRRDLPRWDEDKRQRAKLRGDFISLQNRIALSRRASWAESQSSS